MKNFMCVIICSSVLFLFSCNGQENTGNNNNTLLKDSLAAENRAVDTFNKLVLSSHDSINKYKMAAVNDSCLKYIYTIYGAKHLKKYDSLTIAECSIKLTDFKKVKDNFYMLHYTIFIKDTVPIIADLYEGALIHTFEYNIARQKITKAYLGQHESYMDEKELTKLYHYSLTQSQYRK